MGLPRRASRELRVGAAMLSAFRRGDEKYFVRVLKLMPWQDSPLVARAGTCTHGHQLDAEWPGWGCSDQHEAWKLRQRILAEIERRSRGRRRVE